MEQINQSDPNNVVVKILIGNKCDLDGTREVSTDEGHELAKELDIMFLETSAKDNSNVEELFVDMAREMVKRAGSAEQGNRESANGQNVSLKGRAIGEKKKCC